VGSLFSGLGGRASLVLWSVDSARQAQSAACAARFHPSPRVPALPCCSSSLGEGFRLPGHGGSQCSPSPLSRSCSTRERQQLQSFTRTNVQQIPPISQRLALSGFAENRSAIARTCRPAFDMSAHDDATLPPTPGQCDAHRSAAQPGEQQQDTEAYRERQKAKKPAGGTYSGGLTPTRPDIQSQVKWILTRDPSASPFVASA
jgi:hypothetical protein